MSLFSSVYLSLPLPRIEERNPPNLFFQPFYLPFEIMPTCCFSSQSQACFSNPISCHLSPKAASYFLTVNFSFFKLHLKVSCSHQPSRWSFFHLFHHRKSQFPIEQKANFNHGHHDNHPKVCLSYLEGIRDAQFYCHCPKAWLYQCRSSDLLMQELFFSITHFI